MPMRNGLWHARSSAFYETEAVKLIGQWRIVPDLFIVAGAFALLVFVAQSLWRLKPATIRDGDEVLLPGPEQ